MKHTVCGAHVGESTAHNTLEARFGLEREKLADVFDTIKIHQLLTTIICTKIYMLIHRRELLNALCGSVPLLKHKLATRRAENCCTRVSCDERSKSIVCDMAWVCERSVLRFASGKKTTVRVCSKMDGWLMKGV
jgi:hypothetical protein